MPDFGWQKGPLPGKSGFPNNYKFCNTMKHLPKIIFGEICILLIVFQFVEIPGGHASHVGIPWPFLRRWYSCDGVPSESLEIFWFGAGISAVAIPVFLFACWKILNGRFHSCFSWSRWTTALQISLYIALLGMNIFYSFLSGFDRDRIGERMKEGQDFFIYGAGWPMPYGIYHAPVLSEHLEQDYEEDGNVTISAESAPYISDMYFPLSINLLLMLFVSVAAGLFMHYIAEEEQSKQAEPDGSA